MRIVSTLVASLGAATLVPIGVSGPQGPATRELGGVWTVTLWREQPDSVVRANGEIALLRGSWIDRANLVTVRPHSIYGIYDVDFTPFGFDCRPQRGVPLVGGHDVPPDSAEFVLNPQTDHGGVALKGRVSADSIFGAWYERRAGGSSGRFVMRRE